MSEFHVECLETTPSDPWAQLFLAHGAGTGWDHAWLNEMAAMLAAEGIWVRRIEFPYAQWIRKTGRRRPPQPIAQLVDYYAELVALQRETSLPCFVGGKSMGGRVAAMLASNNPKLCGVLAYGYPFHPVKKPENLRLLPLQEALVPVLVVQGTRDPFGTQSDVQTYDLGEGTQLVWLEDGDHDWKPRKASGQDQMALFQQAVAATVCFMRGHLALK